MGLGREVNEVNEVLEAPPECAGDCAGECTRRLAPAPGELRITAAVSVDLDCSEGCDCEPNEQGWCEVPVQPDEFSMPQPVVHTLEWPPPCPVIDVPVG